MNGVGNYLITVEGVFLVSDFEEATKKGLGQYEVDWWYVDNVTYEEACEYAAAYDQGLNPDDMDFYVAVVDEYADSRL